MNSNKNVIRVKLNWILYLLGGYGDWANLIKKNWGLIWMEQGHDISDHRKYDKRNGHSILFKLEVIPMN